MFINTKVILSHWSHKNLYNLFLKKTQEIWNCTLRGESRKYNNGTILGLRKNIKNRDITSNGDSQLVAENHW